MTGLDIAIVRHAKLGDAEQALLGVIEARGHRGCIIDPFARPYALLPTDKPDVVIARCELDSFQNASLSAYLTFFEWCAFAGVPVVNSRDFILLGQDKFNTHLAVERQLRSAGAGRSLNPQTSLGFGLAACVDLGRTYLDRYGSVVVKKPQSGCGEDVFLVHGVEALGELVRSAFDEHEPVMLQQPITKERGPDGRQRDLRVLACRQQSGRVETVAALYRYGREGEFKTNGSPGGEPGLAGLYGSIDPHLQAAVEIVMNALSGDVAGLDFVRDPDGAYWFLEVNVAFETRNRALALTGLDIWTKTVELAESRVGSGKGKR